MPGAAAETIAAVATPPGRGGVGIVRISGPRVPDIARALLGQLPTARYAHFGRFLDAHGAALDEGLALYFSAPRSFTGEDVLELQGHGGPVVMGLLMARACELGARPARPGEFSERAFLNNKLDLAQAEAVADLIDAGSEAGARSALRSLQGAFSAAVNTLVRELTELRTYIEAAIDFPDEEDVDYLAEGQVDRRLQALQQHLDELQRSARQGRLLHDGMTVVLAGPPNAGKSSLLNVLAGQDAAIVSEIPGTTRDIIREAIHLDGLPLHVLDTAGLREAGEAIEAEGMRRARQAMEQADRILLVLDDSGAVEESALLPTLPPNIPLTVVHNKIDVSGHRAECLDSGLRCDIYLSAKNGGGLDALREHLKSAMGYRAGEEGVFMARQRHLDAIGRAAGHLGAAQHNFTESAAGELIAEDLRQAQQTLSEITGEFSSDDLLGKIFSSFCIGK